MLFSLFLFPNILQRAQFLLSCSFSHLFIFFQHAQDLDKEGCGETEQAFRTALKETFVSFGHCPFVCSRPLAHLFHSSPSRFCCVAPLCLTHLAFPFPKAEFVELDQLQAARQGALRAAVQSAHGEGSVSEGGFHGGLANDLSRNTLVLLDVVRDVKQVFVETVASQAALLQDAQQGNEGPLACLPALYVVTPQPPSLRRTGVSAPAG